MEFVAITHLLVAAFKLHFLGVMVGLQEIMVVLVLAMGIRQRNFLIIQFYGIFVIGLLLVSTSDLGLQI